MFSSVTVEPIIPSCRIRPLPAIATETSVRGMFGHLLAMEQAEYFLFPCMCAVLTN